MTNVKNLLGNRIHVRPLPQATQSASGILYSPNFRDDQKQFEVLAVGTGQKLRVGKRGSRRWVTKPIELKAGDKVLADTYGDHVTLEDGSKIINADWVLASW